MKKKIIYLSSMSIVASTLFFSNSAFAQDIEVCPNGLNPSWDGSCDHTTDDDAPQQTSCPNGLPPSWNGACDHTSEEPVEQPTSEPVAEPESEPAPNPGMSPGENAGWAVIDENGNTENIIVCNPEACGSGWHGGKRVVLQTLQENNGNVAAYLDSYYDFNQGIWVYVNKVNGAKYQIPLDKPNFDNLVCFENCPPPPCEEDPNYMEREDCSHFADGTSPIPMSEIAQFDFIENDSAVQILERSQNYIVDIKNNDVKSIKIIFKKKVKKFAVVAKKWNADGVQKNKWNIKLKKSKKFYTFNIDDKYQDWKFIIKNKNIKRITIAY